jgi:hypothetical protein
MNIERGEIFVAALDPVVGHEVAKTRPVVIVSNNIGNTYSGTVTIIPVTSKNLNPSFRKNEDKLNFCHIFYGTVNFFDNIFSMLLNNISSLAKVVP